MADTRRLATSTAVFGVATAISRVAGLVREIVAAAVLGSGPVYSAFTVAFNLPNLVRAIVADNAISARLRAGVPGAARDGRGEGGVAGRGHGAVDDGGAAGCVVGACSSCWRRCWCRCCWSVPDNVSSDLVVTLTRILFPIVVLMGLSGVVTGILNAAADLRRARRSRRWPGTS